MQSQCFGLDFKKIFSKSVVSDLADLFQCVLDQTYVGMPLSPQKDSGNEAYKRNRILEACS